MSVGEGTGQPPDICKLRGRTGRDLGRREINLLFGIILFVATMCISKVVQHLIPSTHEVKSSPIKFMFWEHMLGTLL